MKWQVLNPTTGDLLRDGFPSKGIAENYIRKMGPAFSKLYEVQPETDDPWLYRVLTEGLVQGDLRRIVLPQISIDEYVPGDPNTDNIVIAFFIKGVPEAVIPFRDFIMRSPGIIDVAYGDSDTIPNTSIVYAEMSRENFRFDDLKDIMEQVSLLTDLEIADFSLMFPNLTDRVPYSEEAILRYFRSRSRKKNWQAQKKAFDQEDEQSSEEQRESIIEFVVDSF